MQIGLVWRGTLLHRETEKQEKICTNKTKYVYPGGFFKAQQTIFEKLEECDIQVPAEEQIFPWFIVCDFEAMLQKLDAPGDGRLQ
jgi:hypothetical protein